MLAERVIEWTQEWKQQGLEAGRQEGHQEGESLLLQRLLTLKFGPLDEAARTRLATADSETLLARGDRVLTAACLAEVFGKSSAQ